MAAPDERGMAAAGRAAEPAAKGDAITSPFLYPVPPMQLSCRSARIADSHFQECVSRSGQVAEWLKAHAWKACIRQKRIGGSNPPLSAKNLSKLLFLLNFFSLLSSCYQSNYQKPRHEPWLFCLAARYDSMGF